MSRTDRTAESARAEALRPALPRAGWVAKLVAAIDPRPDDTFLEIGPGRGALTRPLAAARRAARRGRDRPRPGRGAARTRARRTSRVVARRLPRGRPRRRCSRGEPRPVRVVGNLPYNVVVADPVQAARRRPTRAGAFCRRDADAAEGSRRPARGRARVAATTARWPSRWRCYADVERCLTLPPGAFRPPPKVTSAVVRLRFRPPRRRRRRPRASSSAWSAASSSSGGRPC